MYGINRTVTECYKRWYLNSRAAGISDSAAAKYQSNIFAVKFNTDQIQPADESGSVVAKAKMMLNVMPD